MIKKSVSAPAPVSFKKTKYLIIISIALVLVLLFSFGFRQGFAILGPDISIVREISYIGETDSIESFLVLLHIESNKYLIGIKEFLPENSKVISYSLDNSYGVFEFKESENTWLIGDSSKKVNAGLSYILEADSTDELNGDVLYSLNDNVERTEIEGDSSLCFFPICMEKEIIAGDFYPLVFNAGEGFLSTAWISRIDGRSGGSTIEICDSSECFGQQKVYVFFPDDFADGEYKLQVYDSANEQWIEFLFSVIGGRDLNIPVTECSELNVSGATYVLMNNITIDEDCFIITADDVVLDGNGYTIDGDDLGVDYGILVSGRSSVTIKNLLITDFEEGIYLNSSSNNNLTNIISNSNFGTSIFLESSSNNLLSNITVSNNFVGIYLYSGSNSNTLTTITANSNNYYGILLNLNNSNNQLTGINASDNARVGIALVSSFNSNTLTAITANNNNIGIWLSESSNNTLSSITANNNTDIGIFLYISSNNTLSDIIAIKNKYGVEMVSGSNNNHLANITLSNNVNGILLSSECKNNQLTGITANNNSYEGISLSTSANNSIMSSVFCSNAYKDLECLSGSTGNSGSGNKFTKVTACTNGWPVLGVNYENC